MTIRRFVMVLVALVALQAAAFGVWYRDLLRLRRPVAELASDPAAFRDTAGRVLTRSSLTRRQLETLVDGATRAKDAAIQEAALRRIVEQDPEDESARVRLAEVLRRQGRLDEAARLYAGILEQPTADGSGR